MIVELIRHGETVLQDKKCYQGAIDVPLSAEGRQRLEAGREKNAKKRLNPLPEHVYVSPLRRARETASILFPGARQIIIPDLEEMHFGHFEGKNYLEMENDPEYRAWVDGMCLGTCPGGESRQEFADRTCRAFLQVLGMELAFIETAETVEPWQEEAACRETSCRKGADSAAGQEEAVFIVAHGGTQMALLDRCAVQPLRADSEAGEGEKAVDYYSWQLPCGHGYILRIAAGSGACLPGLHILGTRDYTGW